MNLSSDADCDLVATNSLSSPEISGNVRTQLAIIFLNPKMKTKLESYFRWIIL